jgi:small subunit ribosomal protein S5
VLELGGVRDVLTKSVGTQNPINLVKATMDGLMSMRRPEQVAELRGLTVRQVLGIQEEATPSANGAPAAAEAEAAAPEPVSTAEPEAEVHPPAAEGGQSPAHRSPSAPSASEQDSQ